MRPAGLVRWVDVGCAVWSNTRRRATPHGEDPLGGIVVAVTEKHNEDTGEIDRAFLCFDHLNTKPRVHWSTLAESEVDRDAIEALDVHALTSAWRRLAEDIAWTAPMKARRGPATPEEVRCAEAIRDLQAVVFGPGGVLHQTLEQLKPGLPAAPRPMHKPAPGSVFVD